MAQIGQSTPLRRPLRPTIKALPEHARVHNRALVLQTVYRAGPLSRADVARITGLTRMTVGEVVTALLDETLLFELGPSARAPRPGKPGTLLDLNRDGHCIVAVDLGGSFEFRGGIVDLDGTIRVRRSVPSRGLVGGQALETAIALIKSLIDVSDRPVLGVGVGSPGIVDDAGAILTAPNRAWSGLPLKGALESALCTPVVVVNDANAAALAEFSFGVASPDLMVVMVGDGVGAGLILQGEPLRGSRFAAGEIGHIVADDASEQDCRCGKRGCLEIWLSETRIRERIAGSPSHDRVLADAGARLGAVIAPIVGAIDLRHVVLAGPADLLDGELLAAASRSLTERSALPAVKGAEISVSTLGADIVVRGAAALVLSERLGVS